MPVKRASAVRTTKANVCKNPFFSAKSLEVGMHGLSSCLGAGYHQLWEPLSICRWEVQMSKKILCPFGAMINVLFNYLESLQQVLITETPPAVGTCHRVPLDALTPHSLALLN